MPIKKLETRFLKPAVFGANDGIITTFAVVAGVAGAGLSTRIVIILGIANMVADGISMAVGDYLGERSEKKYLQQQNGGKIPSQLWKTGIVTFLAFVAAGTLPLLPYLLGVFGIHFPVERLFAASILATGLALFFVGSLRSLIIHEPWWKNGLEMLAIGSVAATAAYVLGAVIESTLL